jgi:carotenoid cleavage dioxygenase-like enzyme
VFEPRAYGTSSPYGPVNAANTAPLPSGDRLFAPWHAGRPVAVDPVTLSFVGEEAAGAVVVEVS